jgi:hypothetical protein
MLGDVGGEASLEPFAMTRRVREKEHAIHQEPVEAEVGDLLWIKVRAAARKCADLTDLTNGLCGHLEAGALVRVDDVADCQGQSRRLLVAKVHPKLYAVPPSVSQVGWISNKGIIVSKQPLTWEELERGPNELVGLLRVTQRLLLSAVFAEYSEDVLLTTAEMLSKVISNRNSTMASHGYGKWYISQDEYKLVSVWCAYNRESANVLGT